MWVEPGGPVDPAAALPFLGTFSGNQLGYLPGGGGAWLEAGRLRRVEGVAEEVGRYFEALLGGTRICASGTRSQSPVPRGLAGRAFTSARRSAGRPPRTSSWTGGGVKRGTGSSARAGPAGRGRIAKRMA
ncbi:MAG TPA: hypothetical protein VH092_02370 [Urbifossiella sp.]|nr:hypothetical protein [Urbifossiella sp.]